MKNLEMIAAIGKNGELGKDNDLIYHIPEDMKFFKEHTIGNTILMGRKTFESLPHKLPNRLHIVLTSKDIDLGPEVLILHSKEEVLKFIRDWKKRIIVIGGSSLYKEFMEYAETLWLTEIDDSKPADVYFPKFDQSEWKKEILSENTWNDINYTHNKYTRILKKKE